MREQVSHPFAPVFDEKARILILGSFPSVRSREVGFYYGHPQNRFWRVLGAIFEEEIPADIEGKKRFLLAHGIALWDAAASCEIEGSSDSSMRGVLPNDLALVLDNSRIQSIYTNGKTADRVYQKYQFPRIGVAAKCLPSTSPANAAWSLSALCEAWRVILE